MLVVYAVVCASAVGLAVSLARRYSPMNPATAAVSGGVLLLGLVVGGVPVVHEASHWLLYRAVDYRPWLGSGRRDGKRRGWLKLWVACEVPVPRHVLFVQLRIVPFAMAGLLALLSFPIYVASGVAGLGRAGLWSGAVGVCILLSAVGDLRNSREYADPEVDGLFWDDGNGYRPSGWDTVAESCG